MRFGYWDINSTLKQGNSIMILKCPRCGFEGSFKKAFSNYFTLNLFPGASSAIPAEVIFSCPRCRFKQKAVDDNQKFSMMRYASYIFIALLILTFMYLMANARIESCSMCDESQELLEKLEVSVEDKEK